MRTVLYACRVLPHVGEVFLNTFVCFFLLLFLYFKTSPLQEGEVLCLLWVFLSHYWILPSLQALKSINCGWTVWLKFSCEQQGETDNHFP